MLRPRSYGFLFSGPSGVSRARRARSCISFFCLQFFCHDVLCGDISLHPSIERVHWDGTLFPITENAMTRSIRIFLGATLLCAGSVARADEPALLSLDEFEK